MKTTTTKLYRFISTILSLLHNTMCSSTQNRNNSRTCVTEINSILIINTSITSTCLLPWTARITRGSGITSRYAPSKVSIASLMKSTVRFATYAEFENQLMIRKSTLGVPFPTPFTNILVIMSTTTSTTATPCMTPLSSMADTWSIVTSSIRTPKPISIISPCRWNLRIRVRRTNTKYGTNAVTSLATRESSTQYERFTR